MLCPYCKKEVADNSLFCTKCGLRVRRERFTSGVISQYWEDIRRNNEKSTMDKKQGNREEKQAKRKEIVMSVISLLILLVVAFVGLFYVYIKPNNEYQIGLQLSEEQKYDEALEVFEELYAYKDSEEKILLCKYQIAENLYKKGDFLEAADLYGAAGEYEDAQEKKKLSKFSAAEMLYNQGAYLEASEIYSTLDTYRNADAKVLLCQEMQLSDRYQDALQDLKCGNYSAAESILEDLYDLYGENTKFAFLDDLEIIDEEIYTGNEGDTHIIPIENSQIRVYKHGLEVWMARWNNEAEKTWAYSVFDLPDKNNFTHLQAKCVVFPSYNDEQYDITLEIYADDILVETYLLTPENIPFDIDVYFEPSDTITVSIYDNEAVCGGTNLGIVNTVLLDDVKASEETTIDTE